MKRNKIRYQSKPKEKVFLAPSGNIYLRYVDDDALAEPKKGDLMVYPYNDELNGISMGMYGETGFNGYFKADIFDGKKWCLILLNDIFPNGENRFTKKERPEDTYVIVREMLEKICERPLLRTYREHYMLNEED